MLSASNINVLDAYDVHYELCMGRSKDITVLYL